MNIQQPKQKNTILLIIAPKNMKYIDKILKRYVHDVYRKYKMLMKEVKKNNKING